MNIILLLSVQGTSSVHLHILNLEWTIFGMLHFVKIYSRSMCVFLL